MQEYRGKWIAWDDHRERVLAVDETYPGLMQRVEQLGLADAHIERAPGIHSALSETAVEFLEGESSDILKAIRETIPNANEWLDSPNTRLWCKKPRELIGTPQERQLRYLLRGIWNGVTS